jgi:hypothetical protein
MTTVAVLAVGRPTFDLVEATDRVNRASRLLGARYRLVGDDVLHVEAGSWETGEVDAIVLLQATFTDATLPGSFLYQVAKVPVVLWAFPEPRTGARLVLNSLCGINLTAAALVSDEWDVRYLYADPDDGDCGARLDQALGGPLRKRPAPAPRSNERSAEVAELLAASRVGLIGDRPDGFEPCGFTETEVGSIGAEVDRIELEELFGRARRVEAWRLAVDGVPPSLDPGGVEATARLHEAMADLAAERRWDAIATRCWPECFTEFGGAACAAMGRLSDEGVPGVCEADVFGALTSIALRASSGNPVLVADLVDAPADGTLGFWHCGIAPPSMAHPDDPIGYTVHPNRRLPLLHEFRLRPGRVTIARLNRSGGTLRMVIGTGEILDRPRPFAGTCAVIQPDTPSRQVLDTVIAEGLDHHYGITHGDVAPVMAGLAERLGLEVVAL